MQELDDARLALFSAAVGAIYDSALDPAQWPRALEAVRAFVGSRTALIQSYDLMDQNPPWDLSIGYDPQWMQRLYDSYHTGNPGMAIIAEWDCGEADFGTGNPAWPAVMETPFYKEWARPQGLLDILGLVYDKTPTTIGTLVLTRGDEHGPFDDQARADLVMLFPHVRRAVLIARTIGTLRDEAAELAGALDRVSAGVILLSASGAVLRTNAAAAAMLERRVPLTQSGALLQLPGAAAQRVLMRALASAAKGDLAAGERGVSIPIAGDDAAAGDFIAHLLPLDQRRGAAIDAAGGAVAMLLVRSRASSHAAAVAALADRHALTMREREVVQALVDTGGIPMIADVLGIAQTTARTHMTNIFDKTGVRRQADLVKLALETSGEGPC